VESNQ